MLPSREHTHEGFRVMTSHRLVSIVLLAGALGALAACYTNPYTGRSQLLMISAAEEQQLGAQAYQQLRKDPKHPISTNPQEVDPVKRVAARVIDAAKQSKYADAARQFQWEVTVFKADDTPNAFALPGGKIGVYTGIFPAAQNEAGLAAVLGHEVVHALARHAGERMSQDVLAQVGLGAASIALGQSGMSPGASQAAMAALGLGANVGIMLPFSRQHESEADYIGLLLAAQAGYDPREAVRMWERMDKLSQGAPPEFLSTHPGHGTRIQQLQAWMPEALDLYRPRAGEPAADLPKIKGR
jgi:predicted Zn-dependent protease